MIKKIIKNLIVKTIKLIERYEYKKIELNEKDPTKKILNSINVNDYNLLVESDYGWAPFSEIHITQPFTEWEIETSGGKKLLAADEHRVFIKTAKYFCV